MNRKRKCNCDACFHDVGKRLRAYIESDATTSQSTLGQFFNLSEPAAVLEVDNLDNIVTVTNANSVVRVRRVVKRRVKEREAKTERKVDKKENSSSESSEEEVVEKLLDKKAGKVTKYLVKWKGFSNNHNSWEPESNIHSKELIEEFEEDQKVKKGKVYDKEENGKKGKKK